MKLGRHFGGGLTFQRGAVCSAYTTFLSLSLRISLGA